jgi:hypothetical protein
LRHRIGDDLLIYISIYIILVEKQRDSLLLRSEQT